MSTAGAWLDTPFVPFLDCEYAAMARAEVEDR